MFWTPRPPTTDIAEIFSRIIDDVIRAVAERANRGDRKLQPLVLILAAYLQRIRRRFSALIAKYRAGQLPAAPKHARRAEPASPETPPSEPAPQAARPRHRFPTKFGWLCALVPQDAAILGSQLEHLLKNSEMLAFLRAAPQLGRLLRPLVPMLAVCNVPPELPVPRSHLHPVVRAQLPKPPPRPRAPRPLSPAREFAGQWWMPPKRLRRP